MKFTSEDSGIGGVKCQQHSGAPLESVDAARLSLDKCEGQPHNSKVIDTDGKVKKIVKERISDRTDNPPFFF